MSKEVKAALIAATATIIAALIGGIFLLLNSTHNPPPPPTEVSSPSVTVTPSSDHSTPTPSQASTTPTVTVAGGITGTWEGKGVEGGGNPYTDTLFLTQTGNSITGTSNTQRQTGTSSGTITGDISGDSVRLTVYAGCTRYYELTVSQDGKSLNGYYLGCGIIDKHIIELAKQ